MFKTHKVVMLPTEKAKNDNDKYSIFKGILRGIEDDELNFKFLQGFLAYNDGESKFYNDCWQPQHLYIYSDDEIKVGDWYLAKHNVEGHILSDRLILCKANKNFILNHYIKEAGYHFKVIATSDKSLKIPLIEDIVLQKYCEQKGFNEVQVKYHSTQENPKDFFDVVVFALAQEPMEFLSINLDNYITIQI